MYGTVLSPRTLLSGGYCGGKLAEHSMNPSWAGLKLNPTSSEPSPPYVLILYRHNEPEKSYAFHGRPGMIAKRNCLAFDTKSFHRRSRLAFSHVM
jgi:hypothetical protein